MLSVPIVAAVQLTLPAARLEPRGQEWPVTTDDAPRCGQWLSLEV